MAGWGTKLNNRNSMAPVRTTKLSAVNTMLGCIGESPVNQLEDPDNPQISTVSTAQRILEEVSNEVQAEGWSFNSEYGVELTPDVDGNIAVPSDVSRIDVDPLGSDSQRDVVMRGARLYDKEANSYDFSEDESLEVTMVRMLDFEDIPEAARRFITIRAARKLQDRILGSDSIHAYTAQDEMEARLLFLSSEADDADHNILYDPDNFRIIDR